MPRSGDPFVGQVRDHNHRRFFLQRQRILDCPQAHGTAAAHNQDAAPFPDADAVLVTVLVRVIVAVVAANDAAHGFA